MAASTTPDSIYGISITWSGHDIGYIVDGSLGLGTTELVDISSHDSANSVKEYKAGMIDGGELNLTLRFIPGDTTGQKYMYTDWKAGTEREVVVTYPDATTFTFDAIITSIGDIPLGTGAATDISVAMKITSTITHSDLS